MRYFLLAILLTLSPFGYSQIGKSVTYENPTELGEVERYIGKFYALYTLSYFDLDSKTRAYVLNFTNENTLYHNQTPELKSLVFTATQEEFDYFYSFLQQGFKQDQVRALEVGRDLIKTVTTGSRFLHINVDFKNGESASFRVSRRQLTKLFGKN